MKKKKNLSNCIDSSYVTLNIHDINSKCFFWAKRMLSAVTLRTRQQTTVNNKNNADLAIKSIDNCE